MAVFLLGLLCTLFFLEISLRIVGVSGFLPTAHLPENTVLDSDPTALRVLCLGNSHTEGAAETVFGAYPAQLERLLQQRYPGKKFQVVNAGRGNWNSSETLEYLPGFLKKYRPHAVFVMVGEPNAWNYRFFYKQDRSPAWFLNRIRLLKIVRLFDLLLRFRPEGQREQSVQNAFLDLPWFEYPTLAMSWVRYLEVHPSLERVPSGDLEVAEEALVKWTGSDLGRERQLALSVLAEIQIFRGKFEQGKATAEKLLNLPWRPFDLRLMRALERSRLPGSFNSVMDELQRRAPSAEIRKRYERIVAGEEIPPKEDLPFLEEFSKVSPGRLETYRLLTSLYRSKGSQKKIKEVFLQAQRENPLAEGVRDFLLSLKEVKEDERIEIGRSTLVPMFTTYQQGGVLGEGPRLPVGSQMGTEQIEAEFSRVQYWVVSDLRKIVELGRDSGAAVILQTYPRYRNSGQERWPDRLIRSVAKEEGVSLSDTSQFFKGVFEGERREEYYFKAGRAFQDDHLNTRGNALVADLMAKQLEALGLIK